MNTITKMYRTNADIKKYLISQGFYGMYLIPHTRHSKDILLDGVGFDAIGCKKDKTNLYFLQFKTNKKAPKKILEQYKKLNKKYSIKCLWITKYTGGRIEVFE